jgi:type IV pilus assembly protein PilE
MSSLILAYGSLLARRRAMRGVTLMELMVVVVVVAILASVALPSYRRYLLRSQRSEAKIALLQLQTAEEKFYLQNNQYSANITAAPPAGLGLPDISETGKYQLGVALAADANGNANQAYTATATPTPDGGQADDTLCNAFTLDERGTRGVSGTETVEHCWK